MTEQISALVDNEVLGKQELEDLLGQPEQDEQWQRYHLIGDVMRGEHKPGCDFDIAAKVATALESEEKHNLVHLHTQFKTEGPKLTSDDAIAKKSNVINFFSRIGHYGIAASVAVAAIFGVSQYSSSGNEAYQNHQVLDTAPFSGVVSPVSLQVKPVNVEPKNVQQSEQDILEQKKRINAYLHDHQLQQRK